MVRILVWWIVAYAWVGHVAAQVNYFDHARRNTATWALSFAAGYADGISDVLRDKYSVSVFPQEGSRREFYDPRISWVRKYRNWPEDTRAAYPGAKTWLAWTTDAWHLSKTVSLKSMQVATVLHKPADYRIDWTQRSLPRQSRARWWWPVADVALASISFSAGWHLADLTLVRRP